MTVLNLRISLLFSVIIFTINAQVGIGNTNPQATLDIEATSPTSPANNDGILIPRMSVFPSAPGTTRDGLLIFYTGASASGKGFYYWNDGTGWTFLTGAKNINDLEDGKSDTDGSQDGSSIFLGINSGASDDSSDNRNVGIGYLALEDNTIGSQNTAIGYNALLNNTEGDSNTAIGSASLDANTTGIWNTAVGQGSLTNNISGSYNTALGRGSHVSNNSGSSNVTIGVWALGNSASGNFNTVIGSEAGNALSGESNNTIIGRRAMNSYSAGGENVAIGAATGYYGNGIQNTYIGTSAGNSVGTGERNGSVFLGYAAGSLEMSSNRLYIENSSNITPLIYGEFDNDILRVNGELQIGDPTAGGYKLPTTDGANASEVLTTDGNGTLTWSTPTATELDGDVTNELQDLTLVGDELQISSGAPASMRAFINPKYPDGFENIDPISRGSLATLSGSPYTVPTGKNLYITNVFMPYISAQLIVDGITVLRGRQNANNYQTLTSPIIISAGSVVESGNTTIINGFLVDAYCEPATFNTSFNVPSDKIFVLLNFCPVSPSTSSYIRISSRTVYRGNGLYTANPSYSSFLNPIFVDSGETVMPDGVVNGYFIDK
ncbi:hypothetical protein [uncultured Winogradskyella sp.]|uniref:hypothetical protein n=1 Tax=Winogradskyella sp. 4-2091 TaxID=3381659 RepID=UPI00260D4919|nr:hypothetical protein [uncultured Winogradskyella sp.]